MDATEVLAQISNDRVRAAAQVLMETCDEERLPAFFVVAEKQAGGTNVNAVSCGFSLSVRDELIARFAEEVCR